MQLALAHEYFSVHGGAERVVDVLHAMWPQAPVFTFFHDRRAYGDLQGWDLRTSFLQQLPIGGGAHRVLLPLYPRAARSLRVPAATDAVLTSTSAFIKGLSLAERTVHVAYCHSPTRYLWDWSDRYLEEEVPAPLRGVVSGLLASLRTHDVAFAGRVDRWVANSVVVRERIARYYGAESEVVNPPIEVDAFAPAETRGDFWVCMPSRLVAYKRAEIAVQAFNEVGLRLIVVGDGRERASLEKIARENVTFTGRVSRETIRELLGAARGLIFPTEDDFGMVCAEALASGAPVVALARGGAREIVRHGEDGLLVDLAEPEAFAAAITQVERTGFDPARLRTSARRFDRPVFERRIREIVDDAVRRGRALPERAAGPPGALAAEGSEGTGV